LNNARIRLGETVTLEQDGNKFSGIYTDASTRKSEGAVLILHEMGSRPDEAETILPLRTELSKAGWASLSIELTALAAKTSRSSYGASMEAAQKRTQAGLEFLKGKGFKNTVLAGHGLGAVMGATLLASSSPSAIAGFVAIGMPLADDLTPPTDIFQAIEKIKIPMLDIYGERDLRSVLISADRRAATAAKAGNTHYTRVKVHGADHSFTGMNTILAKRVRGWIEKNAPGMELNTVKPPNP
jgi:dienelactone hydrolase